MSLKPSFLATLSIAILSITVACTGNGTPYTEPTATDDAPDSSALLLDADTRAIVADLQSSLPDLITRARVPGMSIAVVRDGRTVWSDGIGVKNVDSGEPVTAETIFEAASLTKPLVAYAILRLVEQGVLELDVPLIDYLPQEVLEERLVGHPLDQDGFRRDWLEVVTARQVLSHSSGLPHGERGDTYPLFFEPGSDYKYSAGGYYLVQIVAEQLRGATLDEIAREQVLDPLGMKQSSLVWREEYETMAHGHDRLDRPQELRRYEEAHAAASLYTTAADYARFVSAVINGEGLSAEMMTEMLTPQIDVRDHDHWSLGFGLQRDDNGDAFWQWGDYGIFRNFVIGYREQKTAVVYLTNSFNGLGICEEVVGRSVGGQAHSMGWLGYDRYDSPAFLFTSALIEQGAPAAMEQLAELRAADPEALDEGAINRLGYTLLGAERFDDAIAFFVLNTEEHPESANTYDSLAEAYERRGNEGDVELAVASYRKSLETIPRDPNENKDFLERLRQNAEQKIAELER